MAVSIRALDRLVRKVLAAQAMATGARGVVFHTMDSDYVDRPSILLGPLQMRRLQAELQSEINLLAQEPDHARDGGDYRTT